MSEKSEDVLYFAEGMIDATDKDIRLLRADNERLRDELRQNGIDYTRAEIERLKGLLKETRPFLLAMSADALLGRIAQALQEPPR